MAWESQLLGWDGARAGGGVGDDSRVLWKVFENMVDLKGKMSSER